jgi:cytoskeletal protein CcmA (bactofilin family)
VLEVKRKPATHSHGTATARALVHSELVPARDIKDFKGKSAVITGEIHFKGVMAVDGAVTGQIGAGSSLNVKQRPSASFATQPELAGEITFKDMVRVNGHVAGSIYSKTGTLIVDLNARIDATSLLDCE